MSRPARPARRTDARPGSAPFVRWIPPIGIVAAVGMLGLAVVVGPVADARHVVVTVNGQQIDRTALRARLVLDRTLLDARAALRQTAVAQGSMTSAEAQQVDVVDQRVLDDPLRAAIDGLVGDELIQQEAKRRGLEQQPADLDSAIDGDVHRGFGVQVRLVTFGQPLVDRGPAAGDWPPPSAANATRAESAAAAAAVGARVRTALEAGASPEEAVAGLSSAGWRASGSERWLPATGTVDGVPPELLRQVRDGLAAPGSMVGPVVDPVSGLAGVARIVGRDSPSAAVAIAAVENAHIDRGSLEAWARARAAERALRAALEGDWAGPQDRVRVSEVVVGRADLQGPPGPYVSFAHLVVDQLPHEDRTGPDSGASAQALAEALRAMAVPDRERRFAELVARANRTPRMDPLRSSGELGYFTRDQLLPDLASPAFAPETVPGELIGPITTVVGPELFIVRGRFEGVLDERANAALVDLRSAADLLAMARRISPPGTADRADGTMWRALAEFAGSPAALRAYRDTAVGRLSEPFVHGGEIVVVCPEERAMGRLDRDELARLLVTGFDQWLLGQVAVAVVVRDSEPLPGVRVDAEPSASPESASSPPAPSAEVPLPGSPQPEATFGIPTPPVVP